MSSSGDFGIFGGQGPKLSVVLTIDQADIWLIHDGWWVGGGAVIGVLGGRVNDPVAIGCRLCGERGCR